MCTVGAVFDVIYRQTRICRQARKIAAAIYKNNYFIFLINLSGQDGRVV